MSDNPQMTLKDKFLNSYGGCIAFAKPEEWPDYVEALELTEDDIPELIHLATIEDDDEIDGRIFACRALGQLKALSAASPLINFLDKVSLYDDWTYEEIPMVLGLMGPEVKPIVQEYVTNTKNLLSVRITLTNYFRLLAHSYPEQRESLITFFVEQISKPTESEDDCTLNGFFICELCDLKAVEVAKEIEQAFINNRVDLTIVGDWNEAQVYLGLKKRFEPSLNQLFFSSKRFNQLEQYFLKRSQPKGFGDRSGTHKPKSKKQKKKKKK